MPGFTKEVVRADLDRLQIVIKEASTKYYIIPKELENIEHRYSVFLKKQKKQKSVFAIASLFVNCVKPFTPPSFQNFNKIGVNLTCQIDGGGGLGCPAALELPPAALWPGVWHHLHVQPVLC